MRRREEREKLSEARERRVLGVYLVPVDHGGDTRTGSHGWSHLVLALPSVRNRGLFCGGSLVRNNFFAITVGNDSSKNTALLRSIILRCTIHGNSLST